MALVVFAVSFGYYLATDSEFDFLLFSVVLIFFVVSPTLAGSLFVAGRIVFEIYTSIRGSAAISDLDKDAN